MRGTGAVVSAPRESSVWSKVGTGSRVVGEHIGTCRGVDGTEGGGGGGGVDT